MFTFWSTRDMWVTIIESLRPFEWSIYRTAYFYLNIFEKPDPYSLEVPL